MLPPIGATTIGGAMPPPPQPHRHPTSMGGADNQYMRLVDEWKRKYARAKNRADAIRAQSQRRWNADLTFDNDSSPRSSPQKPSAGPDEATLFVVPEKHRRAAAESSIRIERLLKRAADRNRTQQQKVRQGESAILFDRTDQEKQWNPSRKAPTPASVYDIRPPPITLADRLNRLALDAGRSTTSVFSKPSSIESISATNTVPTRRKSNNKQGKQGNAEPKQQSPGPIEGDVELEQRSSKAMKPEPKLSSSKYFIPEIPTREDLIRKRQCPELVKPSRTPASDPLATLNGSTPYGEQDSIPQEGAVTGEQHPAHQQRKFPEGTDPSSLTKVERFFYDEEIRIKRRREREAKRNDSRNDMPHRTTVDVRETAQRTWERLAKDVNRNWQKYSAKGAAAAGQHSTTGPDPDPGPIVDDDLNQRPSSYSSKGQPQTSSDSISMRFQSMPVREMKTYLRGLGVVNAEMAFMEKSQLMDLVRQRTLARQEKHRLEDLERVQRESCESMRSDVCAQIEEWRRNRSIRWLLNDINRANPGHDLFLPAYASFAEISKVYKRSLLKIHPDKNKSPTMEGRFRAEETFKAVNESWTKFRKLNDKR